MRREFPALSYTQYPDRLSDYWLPELSLAELRCAIYITRHTLGWRKYEDQISLTQFENGIKRADGSIVDRGTGLSRTSIISALKSLEEKQIIFRRNGLTAAGDQDTTSYALNLATIEDEGVVQNLDHPVGSPKTEPPWSKICTTVVQNLDPQQTTLQQTISQQTTSSAAGAASNSSPLGADLHSSGVEHHSSPAPSGPSLDDAGDEVDGEDLLLAVQRLYRQTPKTKPPKFGTKTGSRLVESLERARARMGSQALLAAIEAYLGWKPDTPFLASHPLDWLLQSSHLESFTQDRAARPVVKPEAPRTTGTSSRPPAAPPAPSQAKPPAKKSAIPDEVLYWNQTVPENARVVRYDARGSVAEALRSLSLDGDFTKYWHQIVDTCARLMSGGKLKFQITLNWLLKNDNWVKVLNHEYDWALGDAANGAAEPQAKYGPQDYERWDTLLKRITNSVETLYADRKMEYKLWYDITRKAFSSAEKAHRATDMRKVAVAFGRWMMKTLTSSECCKVFAEAKVHPTYLGIQPADIGME